MVIISLDDQGHYNDFQCIKMYICILVLKIEVDRKFEKCMHTYLAVTFFTSITYQHFPIAEFLQCCILPSRKIVGSAREANFESH